MLQQTQVSTVIPSYEKWLRRFPDFASLAAAAESDVLHAWQGLGYYARARNLHATAKAVMSQHGGVFPRSATRTRSLPGLGRYTANAVATFAFGESVPIVEANTARLFARLLNLQSRIDSASGQQRLWEFAADLLPRENAAIHNSALIDLGALVCVSGEPNCAVCPVRNLCRAEHPATLPLKRARTSLKLITEYHQFTAAPGGVLLEQSSDRWRGMWILPRLENEPPEARLLYSAEFPFTHHRVTLRVCEAPHLARPTGRQRQFTLHELDSIPMPSPHRRALTALLAPGGTSR